MVYYLGGEDERVVVTIERGVDSQEVNPDETRVRSQVHALYIHVREGEVAEKLALHHHFLTCVGNVFAYQR